MTATTVETRTVPQLLAADPELWRGPSGENVTGEQTARHLEATRDLLARDGWTRVLDLTADDEPAPADAAPLRDKLGWLFRLARAEYTTHYARTLGMALTVVSMGDDGDEDTLSAAQSVLQAVIRYRTGATGYVSLSAWAGRLDRTWEQVSDLLTEAADVARAYGPSA